MQNLKNYKFTKNVAGYSKGNIVQFTEEQAKLFKGSIEEYAPSEKAPETQSNTRGKTPIGKGQDGKE